MKCFYMCLEYLLDTLIDLYQVLSCSSDLLGIVRLIQKNHKCVSKDHCINFYPVQYHSIHLFAPFLIAT